MLEVKDTKLTRVYSCLLKIAVCLLSLTRTERVKRLNDSTLLQVEKYQAEVEQYSLLD